MILKFGEKLPKIDETSMIAENATIIGEVYVGKFSSIWFQAVLRGDLNFISVGDYTSVQDGVLIHVTEEQSTKIGNHVTIGHGAILHGCVIEDHCLIGSGANLLDEVVVQKNSIIAAGAVVSPKTVIPQNSMVMGVPGKVVRQVSQKEILMLEEHADHYVQLMMKYRK